MNGEVVEFQQIDKIVGMLFVWTDYSEYRAYAGNFDVDESFQSIIGITGPFLLATPDLPWVIWTE
ncbi:MAG: hypothetical protein CM15mP8_4740 [Methanobacteriota archaeon]|nr:MAG: hypothetical protein CM15mP8_4740 [Euryarchaeota archaeon]